MSKLSSLPASGSGDETGACTEISGSPFERTNAHESERVVVTHKPVQIASAPRASVAMTAANNPKSKELYGIARNPIPMQVLTRSEKTAYGESSSATID
jgi:hypothetical protein